METIKGFIDYFLNIFKFWIIVQPWELAIRVRCGKNQKLLTGGLHFRVPFFDNYYIQCVRERVVTLCVQNLTSKDLKTLTVSGSIGYEIVNIETLYNTLYEPESTISNMVMGAISDFIYNNDIKDITPSKIEIEVMERLNLSKYGLNVTYFKLLNFAIVKTFRLIQDQFTVFKNETLTQSK